MLKGTNQEQGRPFNKRIVLELIRRHGPVARTDIAAAVSLTVQTVSTIVRELEEDGFVVSQRESPKGRGVPPARLAINPDGGFAIGIYVTPLSVEAALVNLRGDIVTVLHRDAEHLTPDEGFSIIEELVSLIFADDERRRVLGIGLAMPGPFGVESMSFVGPTTMAGWQGIAIAEHLEETIGLPAFLETDMAAAAYGEQLYGRGNEFTNYYYLFFGVGLGGTMVQDGLLLRGHWGNAGEVGHMTAVPDGQPCYCGNRGCLEQYVSLEALRRSGLTEDAWLDETYHIFCRAIRTIENLFDPETIVVGGFVPEVLKRRIAAPGCDFGNTVAARRDRVLPRMIVAGGAGEAVLRGAASLAVRGALSPREGRMFASDLRSQMGKEVVA